MRKVATLVSSLLPLLWTAAAVSAQPSFEGEDSQQILVEMGSQTPDDVARRLVNSQPGDYYLYLQSLWNSGKKDDAVMWFYVGKLRYRFNLLAHPDDADAARYAALNRDFGLPVSNHAAQDPKAWAQQIAAALDWDAAHDNGFTSKTDFKPALERARAEMTQLHDYMLGNPTSLAAEGKVGGIGVLDYLDGVLVDDRRHKAPAYVGALAPQTSLDSIAGSYQDVPGGPNGRALFGSEQKPTAAFRSASVYELSKQDESTLLIVAKADGKEVARRVLSVKTQGDAVTFEDDQVAKNIAKAVNQPMDKDTLTVFLRNDVSGNLIIDMEYLMEGTYPGKKTHMRLLDSNWSVIKRAPAP